MDLNYTPTRLTLTRDCEFIYINHLGANREGYSAISIPIQYLPVAFECEHSENCVSLKISSVDENGNITDTIHNGVFDISISGWNVREIVNRICKYETIINDTGHMINETIKTSNPNKYINIDDYIQHRDSLNNIFIYKYISSSFIGKITIDENFDNYEYIKKAISHLYGKINTNNNSFRMRSYKELMEHKGEVLC